MSAAKRRAARKVEMLVKMDATRSRMLSHSLMAMLGKDRGMNYWHTCMIPLGHALGRRGLRERTYAALDAARNFRIATGGRP